MINSSPNLFLLNIKFYDVSIIIVSWNTKDLTRQCLQSIYKTTHHISFEIIVVDNNSSDGSVNMIKREFPEVKLIENHRNEGFAKANNLALKESNGRYFCMVNSDVIILPGCIERLVRFMDENPDVGISGPRILNPDTTFQETRRYFPTLCRELFNAVALNRVLQNLHEISGVRPKYQNYNQIHDVDILTGCFWIVRSEAVVQVGCLDEQFFMYGEDLDWCKRFWDKNWRVSFVSEAQAIHLGGASSGNAPLGFFLEMHKANLKYWEKHWGRLHKIIYALILCFHQAARILARLFVFLLRPQMRRENSFKIKRAIACIRGLLTRELFLSNSLDKRD